MGLRDHDGILYHQEVLRDIRGLVMSDRSRFGHPIVLSGVTQSDSAHLYPWTGTHYDLRGFLAVDWAVDGTAPPVDPTLLPNHTLTNPTVKSFATSRSSTPPRQPLAHPPPTASPSPSCADALQTWPSHRDRPARARGGHRMGSKPSG